MVKELRNMRKKILFVSEALWIGGIETALVNLLNRMDYDKYDVTCLVVRNSLEMAERITPKCRLIVADREKAVTFPKSYRFSRLYHLTEEAENPSRLHRAMMWAVPAIKWLENRLYIRYIRENLKNERFDTCVIYSDRTAELAVRAIRAEKYLLFYHHGAMRKVYHDEIGYRKAEKIVAVSKGVEEKLRAFRPQYADKMTTIHNLTDIESIRKKSEEAIPETFAEDRFHVVSCGRVAYEKGMDLAVEACAKLVEMGHRNIRWWIVGGGPAEEDVRAKISALHMEDYVTMVGMKANPYPYIKKADLYVQPSRCESYGLTIVEAMILDVPVLSTNTDGAKELIQNGENGSLCKCSAAALAEVIVNFFVTGDSAIIKAAPYEHSRNNHLIISQLEEIF